MSWGEQKESSPKENNSVMSSAEKNNDLPLKVDSTPDGQTLMEFPGMMGGRLMAPPVWGV